MLRERITETLYVFTSELYVQVTATILATTAGVVVVDTLLYPEETHRIKRFIDERLKQPVTHVILTHHHADHTLGTCLFPGAQVIAQRGCAALLNTRGRESLQRLQASSTDMAAVEIVLPTVTFDDQLVLKVGGHTLKLWHAPGHSADSVVVQVEEEHVLLAADTVLPLPYFVDGNYDSLLQSLERLMAQPGYDVIVQGHGEVLLRGETQQRLQADIAYLQALKTHIERQLASDPHIADEALLQLTPEVCGKSRILLNGAVVQLHRQNVLSLAATLRQQYLQTNYNTD